MKAYEAILKLGYKISVNTRWDADNQYFVSTIVAEKGEKWASTKGIKTDEVPINVWVWQDQVKRLHKHILKKHF